MRLYAGHTHGSCPQRLAWKQLPFSFQMQLSPAKRGAATWKDSVDTNFGMSDNCSMKLGYSI
jgi:hypothetical protein